MTGTHSQSAWRLSGGRTQRRGGAHRASGLALSLGYLFSVLALAFPAWAFALRYVAHFIFASYGLAPSLGFRVMYINKIVEGGLETINAKRPYAAFNVPITRRALSPRPIPRSMRPFEMS